MKLKRMEKAFLFHLTYDANELVTETKVGLIGMEFSHEILLEVSPDTFVNRAIHDKLAEKFPDIHPFTIKTFAIIRDASALFPLFDFFHHFEIFSYKPDFLLTKQQVASVLQQRIELEENVKVSEKTKRGQCIVM